MSDLQADQPFDIVVSSDGPVALVAVSGELDMATVEQFHEAVDRVVSDGGDRLLVDLAAVTFMDSSGLSGLLRVRERATRFAIVPSPAVRRVIELVGLEDELVLAASADDGRSVVSP